jgi:DNA-binding response OmpR family regulator
LTAILTEHGYHAVPFEGKLEALEWIEDIKPDLIISDLNSPQINGFEFLKRIRENPRTHHIPVIFFTGFDSRENRIAAFALGANDYLPKSLKFDSHYLFTIIDRTLGRKQG